MFLIGDGPVDAVYRRYHIIHECCLDHSVCFEQRLYGTFKTGLAEIPVIVVLIYVRKHYNSFLHHRRRGKTIDIAKKISFGYP